MRRLVVMLLAALLAAAVRGDGQLERLRAEAEAGDVAAIDRLAYLYETGSHGVERDDAEATRLYGRAAALGDPLAQNFYGYRLFNGIGAGRDTVAGLEWMERAAVQGDPRAAGNLGFLLTHGRGVERDYARAAYWLERAADGGVPTAMSLLGDLCRQGLGMPADTLRATALYERAAEAGLADAALRLASMNRARWRRLPACEAYELGRRYYTGVLGAAGVELLGMSVQTLADDRSRAHALALLGDAYARGRGAGYDYGRSLRCYLEAAMLGDPSAQFYVAEALDMYPDILDSLSETVAGDPLLGSAAYWYGRAAEGGVADAAAASRRLLHH